MPRVPKIIGRKCHVRLKIQKQKCHFGEEWLLQRLWVIVDIKTKGPDIKVEEKKCMVEHRQSMSSQGTQELSACDECLPSIIGGWTVSALSHTLSHCWLCLQVSWVNRADFSLIFHTYSIWLSTIIARLFKLDYVYFFYKFKLVHHSHTLNYREPDLHYILLISSFMGIFYYTLCICSDLFMFHICSCCLLFMTAAELQSVRKTSREKNC